MNEFAKAIQVGDKKKREKAVRKIVEGVGQIDLNGGELEEQFLNFRHLFGIQKPQSIYSPDDEIPQNNLCYGDKVVLEVVNDSFGVERLGIVNRALGLIKFMPLTEESIPIYINIYI